jgi:hypothetical protein
VTISKGTPWGRRVARPDGLRVAADDAELAALLSDRSELPTAVAGGDMWRTVGAADVRSLEELNELPIDLLDVDLGGGPVTAVSHIVARVRWARGGWMRGPVIAVMNAEFVGAFDVAPRGHPNDGRVEVVRVDPSMTFRQRLAVRSRLRTGRYLPHPQISTRSVRRLVIDDVGTVDVVIDGRSHGATDRIDVTVRPDAAVLYA